MHLHRLVAGGLVMMFVLATWLARKETSDRPWIFRASLAGVGMLLTFVPLMALMFLLLAERTSPPNPASSFIRPMEKLESA